VAQHTLQRVLFVWMQTLPFGRIIKIAVNPIFEGYGEYLSVVGSVLDGSLRRLGLISGM
jgi:hypothetical protein